MKRFSFLFVVLGILVSCMSLRAAQGDTTLVPLLTKVTFPGQPTTMDAKVSIPTKSWARIIMKVKLECPCSKGKGEWDYTNTYFIKVPTGKTDDKGNPLFDRIEIARFITPYWGSQPSSTNYTWWWDVTDYAFLMKDSTTFSVSYDGWTSSAAFTVWLEAIEGVPPYQVFGLDYLVRGYFTYGNPKRPIDDHLLNLKFKAPDSAQFSKLKITTTGHGGYGNQAVAEFIDKTHHVNINGTERFTQHLWRSDCGANPLYPQDGTWVYPRAGWCPGDIVPTWDWDISSFVTKGDSTRVDYKMQPFVVDTLCDGGYNVAAQVMYAKQPNFTNDASLEEILAPNVATAKTRYNRMNPICGNPVVRIRNNGKAALTSVSFEYGVRGEVPLTFTWKGKVDMMGTADITLPAPDWKASFAASTRQFDCRIVKTNDVNDEYPLFNSLSSTYSVPPTYESDIEVKFKTNRQAQNQGYYWTIKDASGSTVASRESSSLEDQTLYIDSLKLSNGCYTFEWVNPSSIGLAWWATNAQLGPASLSLSSKGTIIQAFPGDCGNGVHHQFLVGEMPHIKVLDNVESVDLGPVAMGDSIQKTVSIEPVNSAGLKVNRVAVQSIAKGFSLVSTDPVIPSGSSLNLAQGERMNITVQYKPQVATKKAASLIIESNDVFQPSVSISLAGFVTSTSVADDELVRPLLRVYPSTTSGHAEVVMSIEALQSSNAHCALFDNLGRELMIIADRTLKPGSNSEVGIDVSHLNAGMYFVVLRSGSQCSVAPLIVQH